ncbi:UrcA family protein [Parvularcula sp. ZS-1/3]|uniref:UrcA family protein n=1 Tax=Parvularcula mediterranea TaxID=2732508 RepID=A0A7Y3RN15_9PROT|nr:UrcA family protein [Parvularcula mediterranea]NNU16635.1 UrcA family protein [Parvularcula mediterranea]
MKRTLITAAAALFMAGGIASADELDTFEIDVILADLSDAKNQDDFEKRLKRAARDYCEREAPYATIHQLRDCQAQIIAAVEDSLNDDGIRVAFDT